MELIARSLCHLRPMGAGGTLRPRSTGTPTLLTRPQVASGAASWSILWRLFFSHSEPGAKVPITSADCMRRVRRAGNAVAACAREKSNGCIIVGVLADRVRRSGIRAHWRSSIPASAALLLNAVGILFDDRVGEHLLCDRTPDLRLEPTFQASGFSENLCAQAATMRAVRSAPASCAQRAC